MTGRLSAVARLRLMPYVFLTGSLLPTLIGAAAPPSGDEILARIEIETHRRNSALREYSGARQYKLSNLRFGKQADVAVTMNYREPGGERYTVLTRSGSEKLNGIIDKVIASEAGVSLPEEHASHEIASANYRVRLLGTEVAAGRSCYVLNLTPRSKSRFLIVGKAWIDPASYSVVRIEGHFAASLSVLVGTPQISEEFIEVHGFWLPGHVRSVSTSFLLGPTELEIFFSNYQLD